MYRNRSVSTVIKEKGLILKTLALVLDSILENYKYVAIIWSTFKILF